MISMVKHSWEWREEELWWAGLTSTTLSDFHLCVFTPLQFHRRPFGPRGDQSTPTSTSQYETTRACYIPWSQHSYRETNVSVTSRTKSWYISNYRFTINLRTKISSLLQPRATKDIYACVPCTTPEGAIHTVVYLNGALGIMGFNVCMAESRVPVPTP